MDDRILQETEEARPSEAETSLTTIKEQQVGTGSGTKSRQEQETSPKKSVAERLKELVERDEQFRSKVDLERIKRAQEDPEEKRKFLEEMKLVDRVNRAAVQEMIDRGELQTAEDFNNAALIFQHGEIPEDFRKAFNLSLEAVRRGMLPERTLLAQAFDRYMITSQLAKGVPGSEAKQRFGTQEYPDANGNLFRPINDGLATGEEKVVLGIPLVEDEQEVDLAPDATVVIQQLQEKLNGLPSQEILDKPE